ncbi:MAG: flagellar assembly protein T N-terminal domain-containing protein, partial [Candidatus Thorarchaeota archaeon]
MAETQVTAEGVAAVVGGDDPGRIRDEALRDALRRAVEIGVGVMVRAESQMENYEVLRDQIWTATSGYVRSYQVLRETQDEDFFRITIRAVVDTLALGENLENLGFEIGLIGNPRIVVT